MKKISTIAAAILLAVGIAAGSFWGGMAYQTRQTSQARTNFFASRGLTDTGQFPADAGQFPNDQQFLGFAGGRGANGQVKTIDGNVMTLSTAQDVTTVYLSETTQIEKTVSGTLADLEEGQRVVVSGERDDKGNITASRIQILSDNAVMLEPPATRTAP